MPRHVTLPPSYTANLITRQPVRLATKNGDDAESPPELSLWLGDNGPTHNRARPVDSHEPGHELPCAVHGPRDQHGGVHVDRARRHSLAHHGRRSAGRLYSH